MKSFRDPVSGLTHFIAILISLVGTYFLVQRPQPDSWSGTITLAVFAGAMVLLYLTSTLYHWLPLSGEALKTMRKMDHMAIFIFIAATYTPICLITLNDIWGWSILAGVWTMALLGILFKFFWLGAPRVLYTSIYLIMGWFIVIGIYPLLQQMASPGLLWMLAGGLFYTLGAIIYARKKPNPWPGIFGFHEIFHVMVMAGSFCHYLMIYFYAVPAGS